MSRLLAVNASVSFSEVFSWGVQWFPRFLTVALREGLRVRSLAGMGHWLGKGSRVP